MRAKIKPLLRKSSEVSECHRTSRGSFFNKIGRIGALTPNADCARGSVVLLGIWQLSEKCCVWSAEMRQVVENNLLDGSDPIEKRPVRLPTIVAHALKGLGFRLELFLLY
jgi:hypothetical protein